MMARSAAVDLASFPEIDMTNVRPPPDSAATDPRPMPPRKPEPDECCRSGCTPCVFDLYDEALTLYEVSLGRWKARQAARRQP